MKKNILPFKKTYSTTKLLTAEKPIFINNPNDKVKTQLFLSENKNRIAEGGLRTKGFFKESYPNKPLISIITVVYNGEKYLEETINSVISQTYDNVEFIIIDGGSTDATLEIIKKYENVIDYFVSEKDEGIYDAMNKGIKLFHGEWCGFLGADDKYILQAIKNYVNKINSTSSIDFISSRMILCHENGKPIRTVGKAWNWNLFSKYMYICHTGALHRRKYFEKYGIFNSSYKICGDYELLLRARDKLQTSFLNLKMCYMRTSGISNNSYIFFFEAYNAKKLHKTRSPIICLFDMLFAIIKWKIRKLIWY